jgi:RNA polymerase sigma-70 factor (ECF subfamily)
MDNNQTQIDGREFVSLITANQRRIYAYILTLVPNFNDADDVMQETTAMMWEQKNVFQPGTDFVAWGARIAYFKTLDYRKKLKRSNRMIMLDEQFEHISAKALAQNNKAEDMIHRLKDCLQKLSSHDQYLMHLRYCAGLTAKEVSMRIHKSLRNIYYNLSRIQGQLLACVERNEP